MSDLHLLPGDPLARLTDRASKQSPAAGDDEALMRDALIVGRARVRHAHRRRKLLFVASLALLVLAFGIPLALRPTPAPMAPTHTIATPAPSESTTLALGAHRIETTPATRLSLQEGSLARVSLRLDTGSALFDVATMAPGDAFEVHAPDLTAIVHGTVFAMTVHEGRTRVDVFEGRVEVRGDFGTQMLERGDAHAVASIALSPLLSQLGEEEADARDRETPAIREMPETQERDAPAPTERGRRRGVTLAQLEAWRDAGDFDAVLRGLGEGAPPVDEVGAWSMVEGDAHRALGHEREAALAYARAVEHLSPSRAAVAGVLAARLLERLGEDARALAVLESSHAAERGAPLEEQALARRAHLLARLGRDDEAREAARDYVVTFSSGPSASLMRDLANH